MSWPETVTWGWDPYSEVRRLQREMNRLFDGQGWTEAEFPAVNIWSNTEEVLLSAEAPGMDAKAIDISVQGDVLTLRGRREPAEPSEGTVCHRCERWNGSFARTVRLPFEVDPEKVNAKYRNGVLTVTLPRAEASKPRRIAIAAE